MVVEGIAYKDQIYSYVQLLVIAGTRWRWKVPPVD